MTKLVPHDISALSVTKILHGGGLKTIGPLILVFIQFFIS